MGKRGWVAQPLSVYSFGFLLCLSMPLPLHFLFQPLPLPLPLLLVLYALLSSDNYLHRTAWLSEISRRLVTMITRRLCLRNLVESFRLGSSMSKVVNFIFQSRTSLSFIYRCFYCYMSCFFLFWCRWRILF